jgi:hypothetical protein
MRLRCIIRTLALLAIATGSTFFSSCRQGVSKKTNFRLEQPQFNEALGIKPQSVKVRKVEPWPAKLAWKRSAEDLVPSLLIQIQPGKDGMVYGLDRQSGCVVQVSPKKAQQICIRDERTKMPLSIANFQVDDDGVTFIATAYQHRLWRRRADGTVEELRDTPDVGYFALDRGRVVYEYGRTSDSSANFRWIDLRNPGESHVSKVPFLLRNEREHRMAIVGTMAVDRQRHRIYHISERCGLLLGIGDAGEDVGLSFARATIDSVPLPKLEIAKFGEATVTRFAFGQATAATAMAADAGLIWVVGMAPTGPKTFKHILDVYDGQQGDYLRSYEMPMHLHGLSVKGSRFFFSADRGVEVWDFPAPEPGASKSAAD